MEEGHAPLKDFGAHHRLDLEDAVVEHRRSPRHRFVRLNPRFDVTETLHQLEAEVREWLGTSRQHRLGDDAANGEANNDTTSQPQPSGPLLVRPVPWMDPWLHFYAVPSGFKLSQSPSFRQGRIYGQDVSSGAAVAALLTSRYDENDKDGAGDRTKEVDGGEDGSEGVAASSSSTPQRILDLCCSPGLKLCAMADYLAQHRNHSTTRPLPRDRVQVVGVDVSADRLALCKRIVHKYQIHPETSGSPAASTRNHAPHIQLYCGDGTTFGADNDSSTAAKLIFDSNVAHDELVYVGAKRKRQNKSARMREQRRLLLLHQEPADPDHHHRDDCYDFVLVDAECSTDGSFRHVQQRLEKAKRSHDGPITVDPNASYVPNKFLTDPKKLAELVELQRRLIDRGFRLLRPGGRLVYSTCSLSEEQNEGVVEWLLRQHPTASIVPIDFLEGNPTADARWISNGKVKGTVRFLPVAHDFGAGTGDPVIGEGFFLSKFTKLRSRSKTT